ncbi:DUF2125 domain-containing protein [Paracraurococcus ruber]|uniref:DUF2125 domain-containing protein n=1 Tax=Paracraurococcus ruber TaxID=77675 RepID=UPI0010580488|nr:DUF2125 domain-containing protein [Paracraurococcus ruber]TDG33811.1 DUF2125 domain-containing protein [Paracraurococcus ruber]
MLRAALGTALLGALLVAGHALLWRWMGAQLEAGFRDWAAQRRALGWRVEHGPPDRGGWPFAATLTLPAFRLEGGAGTLPGGLDWQAEALVLRLAPPRLDRLAVLMPGRQRLRLGALDLPFAADRLQLSLPLERNVLPSEARLEADRLRLGTPLGTVEARSAEAEVEARLTAIEGEPALAFRLSALEVLLPPAAGLLGRIVQAASLDAALSGPVPPGRGPAAKAEAWRDGGGTFELRELDLRWGSLAGTATATLTLDEALQPMGAGVLRLTGAADALQAAREAGLLTRQAAAAGTMAVRLLSRSPAEGAPAQLELPLTLESRVLTAARLPLVTLPAWRWPAPPPLPDAVQDPSLPARD